VTVPCAASGWLKTIETYGSGKLTMAEILAPAIRIAKEGVPEHEANARSVCLASWLPMICLSKTVAEERSIDQEDVRQLERVSFYTLQLNEADEAG